ncbi:hypothetical protein C1637_11180 [Chryseobacterium lactis]|uniref:Uncharacterized protein n=1 Tax=Chryseobacterium lactis TaxID=1241981 RepID=A0A3G6RRL2_CHRLC|nr:hypothetical protein [Chryseobacterium lactis]AZA80898.1 hypothetical protein EG342_02760 [Chryseobacterium lactis]AZB05899.1 hypothetical protein EG341_18885 [Chryseobacterium lactis]PNW13381.1 hypothetical protein C1637_11180 [Chryseobacterium lactis]
MEIIVTVKQLGKKHPVLSEHKIQIAYDNAGISLENLLQLIVQQQVAAFNEKSFELEDEDETKIPQHNYLNILTDTGKAGFGSIYNLKKADLQKAQENAIQAFQDGMFAVFYNDEQLEDLHQTIDLSAQHTFTFIRLTFLAGSYW